MSWETVRLEKLYSTESRNGLTKPSKVRGAGYKMINMGELFSNDRIFDISMELVPLSENEKLTAKVEKGDLLFARQSLVLEGAGKCSIVMEASDLTVFESHLIRVRLDRKKADPLFYYYYFRSPFSPIKTIVSQCAQAGIRGSDLQRLDVVCPSLEIQHRIASILSAYDDLIENNRKQIKLLEEAAQRLYKEWFVDLRFPGYENTPIFDGLPEGWKRKKLVDIAYIQYGFAFDGTLFNSERRGTPILRIRNIPEGATNDYTTETADNQYLVHNGDIVVGMDGEFHINTWSGDVAYLVQRTCHIEPHDPKVKGWLLYAIYEPIKFFEKTVIGATVAHLGKKHIDTINLLCGTEDLYKPFQALFEKRQALLNQNRKLSEARDRLLPKLMSGEMEL
ncbi:MAG: restriction endonuclease subunit S [Clostridia bacterium]|nr:restriction endonuclease subunit S [Clostridia bacterium]